MTLTVDDQSHSINRPYYVNGQAVSTEEFVFNVRLTVVSASWIIDVVFLCGYSELPVAIGSSAYHGM